MELKTKLHGAEKQSLMELKKQSGMELKTKLHGADNKVAWSSHEVENLFQESSSPQASDAPPFGSKRGLHTYLRGRGLEDPIPTKGQTLWYFMYSIQ
jgi:hypothetical protein